MRKYLCLLVAGSLFLLSACDDNQKGPLYPIEQKKKMEDDLNTSLDRSINRVQSQEDL